MSPSKVIRLDDDNRSFPFELGYQPTPGDVDAEAFSVLLSAMGRAVREISPSSIIVASASGDPGLRPIIKHMVPAGDGVGTATLYVRADSAALADMAEAALELQSAVIAAVAPFVKDPSVEPAAAGE